MMLANIRTRASLALALLFLALLAACGPQPGLNDGCDFTWTKTQAPADNITVVELDDHRQFPTGCQSPGIKGCYDPFVMNDGRVVATIYIHKTNQIKGGACDTRRHELRHANGETHAAAEMYTPRDFTR